MVLRPAGLVIGKLGVCDPRSAWRGARTLVIIGLQVIMMLTFENRCLETVTYLNCSWL